MKLREFLNEEGWIFLPVMFMIMMTVQVLTTNWSISGQ